MQRLPRGRKAVEFKASLKEQGRRVECAACFWQPPKPYATIVNLHHIVPVGVGGADTEDNLILLCPNCHALAHAMFPVSGGCYRGPRERVILLVALRQPEVYMAFKKRQAVDRLAATPLDPGLVRWAATEAARGDACG